MPNCLCVNDTGLHAIETQFHFNLLIDVNNVQGGLELISMPVWWVEPERLEVLKTFHRDLGLSFFGTQRGKSRSCQKCHKSFKEVASDSQ